MTKPKISSEIFLHTLFFSLTNSMSGDTINFLELRDGSTHLAGDPGSDVVETAAPRKLLTNIEEGKHL